MIELHCPECGKEIDTTSGVRRCPYCGHKFGIKLNWPKGYDKDSYEFHMELIRKIKRKQYIKIFASVLCILAVCGGIFYYISASKLSETEKMFYNNYRILEYAAKDDYTITVTPGQDGIVFTAKYKDENKTNTYYFLPTTITAKSGQSKTDIIVFFWMINLLDFMIT